MTLSMIFFLLILVALFEHNSTSYFHNGLIFNGEILKINEYPYVMYIELLNEENGKLSLCSGSLIKKLYVLTAAHCCQPYNATGIKVCQGSPLVRKPDFHKVVKKYVHEKYNPYGMDKYDICVLKLEKGFPHIKHFSKIGGSPKDFAEGKKLHCTMIGFGLTGNNKTDGETGYVMTNDVIYGKTACQRDRSGAWRLHLCLVPSKIKKPCQGDSGGPMICNNLQYGTCSHGYPYKGNKTFCGYTYTQVVYEFLNPHKKWIKNIIEPKNKRSSGNLLKQRHYTLHILLSILLCNMLTFI